MKIHNTGDWLLVTEEEIKKEGKTESGLFTAQEEREFHHVVAHAGPEATISVGARVLVDPTKLISQLPKVDGVLYGAIHEADLIAVIDG